MSFLRHREIYQVAGIALTGADVTMATPAPLDSMSLQLVIPWRVALQQSPPPLHQPVALCNNGAALCNQHFAVFSLPPYLVVSL
jgi:hypothetical protein